MSDAAASTPRSTVIPCLKYRDAPRMIEWLCRVFGFQKHLVVADPEGTIAHAELSLGTGMIMLGSVRAGDQGNEFGELIAQPDEIGRRETQSAYVIVPDADAVHDRAVAEGGVILIPIKDESYGGRGFVFRDLEGHIWSVGTYTP